MNETKNIQQRNSKRQKTGFLKSLIKLKNFKQVQAEKRDVTNYQIEQLKNRTTLQNQQLLK